MPITNMNIAQVARLRNFKIDYTKIRTLDYVDKNNIKPQRFAQYNELSLKGLAAGDVIRSGAGLRTFLVTEEQSRPTFSADLKHLQSYSAGAFPKGKVLVLVNSDLYTSVKPSIDLYIKDLAYEGYFAVAYRVKGGTPQELRNFLRNKLPMAGALMVGSLPVAWFEMKDDFYGAAEFPCDLYFMDLDGTWTDPDGNGKFNEHPSGAEPEIWVGRLWTPSAGGNDAALINDYFKRNHLYRKGLFGASAGALAYVDDDWVGFGDCSFDSMFPAANIETITDPVTTDGDRYKAEIQQFRAWAQICAHSSPNGHSFNVPGATSEWVPNTYLRDVNPPNAFFYNLYACSNALFTQQDYMAGWYIFGKSGGSICNGLAAIGSTKTGSMLFFENFYTPMGNGRVIGDAYIDWWKSLGSNHVLYMRQWFYGLTLLGDPTLNWWTGFVPALRNPYNEDVFDHHPRLTTFQWDPIQINGATYNVEIDAFGTSANGKWAAEVNATWLVSGAISSCAYEHHFTGKQRGRWRVRANINGRVCPWSDWRYFTYII